jgi:hypothetical protein
VEHLEVAEHLVEEEELAEQEVGRKCKSSSVRAVCET